MTGTIYTHELPESPGTARLRLPRGAEVLHVARHCGRNMLWVRAEYDPHGKGATRVFRVAREGERVGGCYVGTCGHTPLHVFDLGVEEDS